MTRSRRAGSPPITFQSPIVEIRDQQHSDCAAHSVRSRPVAAGFRRRVRHCKLASGNSEQHGAKSMSPIDLKPATKTKVKVERPKLHKVILVNDDYTPREFVVTVLKGEFRMTDDQAYKVMLTAHQRGVCVVAVFTKDVAETKATRATDAGRAKGYPLLFTTEPEE
jgi:ATP-dependent Clp protease adaptor protein ClpS